LERKIYVEKGDVTRRVVLHRHDQAGCKPDGWIGWLEEGRQHAPKREDEGKDRSALMGENEDEAEDCGKSEKAELAVLAAAEKLVKGPEILRHRHDGYKKRCQEYEDSTQQNAGLRRTRVSVFSRPIRDGD
jgi:hypothetical protein